MHERQKRKYFFYFAHAWFRHFFFFLWEDTGGVSSLSLFLVLIILRAPVLTWMLNVWTCMIELHAHERQNAQRFRCAHLSDIPLRVIETCARCARSSTWLALNSYSSHLFELLTLNTCIRNLVQWRDHRDLCTWGGADFRWSSSKTVTTVMSFCAHTCITTMSLTHITMHAHSNYTFIAVSSLRMHTATPTQTYTYCKTIRT